MNVTISMWSWKHDKRFYMALFEFQCEHSIDTSTRLGKQAYRENKNQMKIFCLRWNRCRIHLDDTGLAFSQLQRENFARR